MFSDTKTEYKFDGHSIGKSSTQGLNNNGTFSFGIDIQGIQFSLTPQYVKLDDTKTTGLYMNALVPLLHNSSIVPYVSASIGYISISDKTLGITIEESTAAYSIGGGVRYRFNNNIFVSGGIAYTSMKFDDIDGSDFSMQLSGWGIKTSLGYRF